MKTLLKLLKFNETEIFDYLRNEIATYGEAIESEGEYLYLPTGHPIVLQAHVDTVTIKECLPVASNNQVYNSLKDPVGGDDRCGVWIMLKVAAELKRRGLPIPNLIFTNAEERGGVGMGNFVKDQVFESEGVRLLVGLDRRGCNEYVTYITPPVDVDNYVASFGFIKAHGSYSDIRDLSEVALIPHVNLSVGYYNQHTANEVIHFDEMVLTANRVARMCMHPIKQLYPLVVSTYYNRYSDRAAQNRGESGDVFCEMCERNVPKYSFNERSACCWRCWNEMTYPQYYGGKKKKKKAEVVQLPQENLVRIVRNRIFLVTNVDSTCFGCRKDWEECKCGRMIKELDKEFRLANPKSQREYWLCLLTNFLVLENDLFGEIKKRELV